MKKTFLGMMVLGLGMMLFSCTEENTLDDFDCTGLTPTYTTDIAPIMTASCTGCHGASSPSGGLNLTTYATVKAEGDLFCSVNHDDGCDAMPQGGAKLSEADIKKIACWTKNGKPE